MARLGRTYIKLGLVRPVSISGNTFNDTYSDTEGLTDSQVLSQDENQVISDPEGLTDSLVLTFTEVNSFSDPEGLTDSVVISSGEVNNFSDTEGLTDSVAFGTSITFSDPEGLTDTRSFVQGMAQNPSDSEGLTDSLSLAQGEVFNKSDPEGLTDNLSLAGTAVVNFSDPEGLTDLVTLSQGEVFTKSDPLGLTDSFVLGTLVSNSFSDTAGLTDSVVLTITADPNLPVYLGYDRTLVQGPGTIYIAPYGATEPAPGATSSAPDAGTWTDLGGLLGGVELFVEQEYEEIETRQLTAPTARRLKKRRLKIKTQLAEATLANLGYALNDSTGVSGVQYQPSAVDEATPLAYVALIVDGWAPGFKVNRKHKRRRIIVRKCLSMDNVEMAYSKDGQTVYTVTWACHYVNGSTPPFRIIDESET